MSETAIVVYDSFEVTFAIFLYSYSIAMRYIKSARVSHQQQSVTGLN